jgi:hypothetical protein
MKIIRLASNAIRDIGRVHGERQMKRLLRRAILELLKNDLAMR